MKRQYCPICKAAVKPSERYRRYLCDSCAQFASAPDGRRLGFSNEGMHGGFIADFVGAGTNYASHVCFVKGVPCWADEARFGGIVIEAIEPDALKSLIDRTGRPVTGEETFRRPSPRKRTTAATLSAFVDHFASTFRPPVPYRGKKGKTWLISSVWTQYMKSWLRDRYQVRFELPLPKRRRLDAALWRKGADTKRDRIDIALEWEWDNNKVDTSFHCDDFSKVFEVNARAGLAVIQTRAHSSGGVSQAARILENLRRCFEHSRLADRPIAIIEIRRLVHANSSVEFVGTAHDLNRTTSREIARWRFP
jgi:hypothetical protein